jgi:hypothetical protein
MLAPLYSVGQDLKSELRFGGRYSRDERLELHPGLPSKSMPSLAYGITRPVKSFVSLNPYLLIPDGQWNPTSTPQRAEIFP